MSLLDQLPRLSAYDPGVTGEGGLIRWDSVQWQIALQIYWLPVFALE